MRHLEKEIIMGSRFKSVVEIGTSPQKSQRTQSGLWTGIFCGGGKTGRWEGGGGGGGWKGVSGIQNTHRHTHTLMRQIRLLSLKTVLSKDSCPARVRAFLGCYEENRIIIFAW